MAKRSKPERGEVSEKAREHAAYLVQGNDPARPADCDLCAELRAAGWLELEEKRPHVRPRWWVRA